MSHPTPKPATEAVLDMLKAAGRRGMLLADVQAALGSSDRTAETLLQKLTRERNLIERRSDKEGKAQNRFRYFAKGYAPIICNNPSKKTTAVPQRRLTLDQNAPVVGKRPKPTPCPSGKDQRFTAAGQVPRIVDSADARGWARMVAP